MRPTWSDVALLIGLLIVAAEAGYLDASDSTRRTSTSTITPRVRTAGADPIIPPCCGKFSGAPHT